MTSTPNSSTGPEAIHGWRLDAQGIWTDAWALMTREYAVLVVAGAVNALVSVALVGGGILLKLGILAQIPALLILTPLSTGVWMLGVRAARGNRIAVGEMFAGFGRYWTVVGIGLVVQIAGLIISLPMYLFMWLQLTNRSVGLGCAFTAVELFVLLPMIIYVSIRLWIAPLLCLDERVGKPGVGLSLVSSWAIGGQSFWPMVGVYIVMGFIMLGTFVLAGVGLIFLGMPLVVSAFGVMYTRVVDSVPRPRCPDCGCDLSASQTLVCPVCGVKGAGAGT
jgi:hypothetical protein